MSFINDIFAIIDRLKKASEEFKDSKVNSILIDLQTALMKLQDENFNMNIKNQNLKSQLEAIKKEENTEQYIHRTKGTIAKYDDGQKEMMICTKCWDSERKIIQAEHYGLNNYKCPNCGKYSFYGE